MDLKVSPCQNIDNDPSLDFVFTVIKRNATKRYLGGGYRKYIAKAAHRQQKVKLKFDRFGNLEWTEGTTYVEGFPKDNMVRTFASF